MTQENKDLLLRDLCARLPYGVKVNYNEEVCTIDSIGNDSELLLKNNDGEIIPKWEDSLFISIEKCKPYLFPLSSMTEEQQKELYSIQGVLTVDFELEEYKMVHLFQFQNVIDWFNKNHFDYRGLIEKGLAIDSTDLNIY